MSRSLVNPAAIELAHRTIADVLQKRAFVPGGDPAMDPTAGGGMPPMGGDPMMGGGGGGDPMAGGMPPAPPMPPPAPAPMPAPVAAQPGAEPIKPKVDVNATLIRMEKMLAKLLDAAGIVMPAADMVADQTDLTNYGAAQAAGNPNPASAISPIQPMGAASPALAKQSAAIAAGSVYDGPRESPSLGQLGARAAALADLCDRRTGRSA